MWQRIQSVFLGLVILCLVVSLLQPVWEGNEGDTIYRLYPIYLMHKLKGASGAATIGEYFPFSLTAILIIATITIAVQEFRRYDNRILQIKLGALNSGFIVLALVSCVFLSRQIFNDHPEIKGGYGISLFLILAAALFNWLAMRFIRRDEKLVRDSDRLR